MVICSRVKLYLTQEQKELFEDNLIKFWLCTNWWIDKIREIESTNIKILHRDYYKSSRKVFDIGSNQSQLCMNVAVKIARTAKKKRSDSPYLSKKQLYFKMVEIKNNKVKLTFGNGYFFVYFKGVVKSDVIKRCVANKINGEWYLNMAFEIQEPEKKQYKRCMGVDLGIAKTAVVCDWNGNNTRFFGGEPFRFKKGHYRDLRKSMQENIKKGNTYKALKNISEKESNWVTDMNHNISREIVNMAVQNKRTIVLEKLTGITERLNVNRKTRKMIKGWSFRELADFIKYKAKKEGITVLEVDPRGTSKECPKCKNYSRSNRKKQERFICTQCGYESNADRVAAMNIALRGTELLA